MIQKEIPTKSSCLRFEFAADAITGPDVIAIALAVRAGAFRILDQNPFTTLIAVFMNRFLKVYTGANLLQPGIFVGAETHITLQKFT